MALPTYFCRSNEKLTQEVRVVNVFERDTYSEVPKRDIYSEVPLRDLKAWSCKDEVVHIRAEPGGVPLKNLEVIEALQLGFSRTDDDKRSRELD